MNLRLIAFAALGLLAAPATAEKLVFDHRLSPPLKAVLDGGDAAMISYNNSDPRHVVDVIAVRGKSATSWTEALVIIARTPAGKVRSAADWTAELQREAQARCASMFTEVARDAASVTLERRSERCPAGYPPIALYRAVGGKKSLFLLAVLVKDVLTPAARAQWMALLATAHLE